jgi:hypothetical protein
VITGHDADFDLDGQLMHTVDRGVAAGSASVAAS